MSIVHLTQEDARGGRGVHILQVWWYKERYKMQLQDHLVKMQPQNHLVNMQLEVEKRWVICSHVLPMRRPWARIG